MAERPVETGDDRRATAPLLVFALALPSAAQVSGVKEGEAPRHYGEPPH